MVQPQKVNSRLVRHEKRRVMRQTTILIGASLLLALAFLFIILPGFFQIFLKFFGGTPAEDISSGIPLQPPVLSAPVEATNSARLTVTGYALAGSQVILIQNGQKLEPVAAGDDGQFTVMVNLEEGDNEMAGYAVSKEGKESNVGKPYTTKLDTKKPSLVVETPEDGQTIESRANQTLTVSGKTDTDAKVYLNDRLVFPNSDGSFSTQFQLAEGENKLTFTAEDEAGNTISSTRTIMFVL